ncbi:MAG: hypothetical protein SVT56_01795 [Chloroflexota bacterium]|nr:hypothetical protein [Chloroflexota bacterium]
MGEKATFHAYLPPIQTAIKISGNGDGARFQLEVAENSIAEFIPVLGMRGKGLLVTIEELSYEETRKINENWTRLDDETEKSSENEAGGVDRRRIDLRRDQSSGG